MSARTWGAIAGVAAVVAALTAGGAAADGGGPSPGVLVGGQGILASGGGVRYFALGEGRRTAVVALPASAGGVVRYRWVRGSYGFPLVAYDGTAEGLSRDGRSLTVAEQATSSPAQTTHFLRFDTRTLRLSRVIALHGSFSYDALSPDGKTMYLIQYLPSTTYVRYLVRAYDLRAGRLVPGAIVDRREPSERMTGAPLTRETSSDGGWVYTLYMRNGARPFVHALDAAHRAAVCIDLPWKNVNEGLYSVRMRLDAGGTKLTLWQPRVGRLAVVDTTTYAVRAFRRPTR